MRDLPPNMTDYLATRASFRLQVPEVYNYARDVVDAWAAREPGKLALLAVAPDGGSPRRSSFADLAASSSRAANFLAAQGVRKGDRVFVMLPRIPDWYDVILGCIKLGAVPMPGTTLSPPAAASEQPPDAEPTRSDDPLPVYFTSGTVAYATVGFRELAPLCIPGVDALRPSCLSLQPLLSRR
jgi:acyl-coenzyme A synthetase/AMP-(fatty) acid ligase